jgi:DNA polymerase III subunit delta
MKLSGQALQAFLRAPKPAVGAVLLYGPERGLAGEHARALEKSVAGEPPDPFRVSALSAAQLRDDPARLHDEASAMCFTGGRRFVRVRDAGDRDAKIIEDYLTRPALAALVVIEAGELGPRSSLRAAFEKAANGAAIACYPDSREAVLGVVTAMLNEANLAADADAVDYLCDNLGADRQMTRRELEKLIAYVGPDQRQVRLGDCLAAVGDGAAWAFNDVVDALGDGNAAQLDLALERNLSAGEHPVALLRAAQRHFQRLLAMAAQRGNDEGYNSYNAPSFGRNAAIERHAGRWAPDRLAAALGALTEAEIMCKSSGLPDHAICRRALLGVALTARRP